MLLSGFSGSPGSLNYVLLVEQEGCFGRWGSGHPGGAIGACGGGLLPSRSCRVTAKENQVREVARCGCLGKVVLADKGDRGLVLGTWADR